MYPALHRLELKGLLDSEWTLSETNRRVKVYRLTVAGRKQFTTERAQRFLRSVKSPFFLTLSYLEVHHQNDSDTFDPPKEFKGKFPNPFIPGDLRPLPGSWPSQWSDYLGCVAKMDETVGTIRRTLSETGLARNTILVFVSDHACHFKTQARQHRRGFLRRDFKGNKFFEPVVEDFHDQN